MKILTPVLENVALDYVLDIVGARVYHIGMNAGLGVIMLPDSLKVVVGVVGISGVAVIPESFLPSFVICHVGLMFGLVV